MKKLSASQTRRRIAQLGIEDTLAHAFGFIEASHHQRYDVHRHSKHQLLRPQHGVLCVETKTHFHTCASPMAIWIPAGVSHATSIGSGAAASLFFSPTHYPWPSREVRQMEVSPLLMHMVDTAAHGLTGTRTFQRQFFDIIAELCHRALAEPVTPALAVPHSVEVKRAVDYLLNNLAEQSIPRLAQAVGMSERTLRRRFQNELALSPDDYLRQARLIKAMQLLRASQNQAISEIALEVGYANQSAFSAAFRRFTQQTPAEFRRAH